MKFPQTGVIKVVHEGEVETMTKSGWVLLTILTESIYCPGIDEHQPAMPMGQSYMPGKVTLSKAMALRTHRYVMHLETGSLAEQLVAQMELLAVKEKELVVERLALAHQCQISNEQVGTIEKQNELGRTLKAKQEELEKKAGQLANGMEPLLADLSKLYKTLGKDRVREILGREIEDPDPTPEDQIKNTYQRLLEEENDENNQTG